MVMQARQVITCGVWKSEARVARITTTGRVGGVRGCGKTCAKQKAHDVIRHKKHTIILYDGTRFNVVKRAFRECEVLLDSAANSGQFPSTTISILILSGKYLLLLLIGTVIHYVHYN